MINRPNLGYPFEEVISLFNSNTVGFEVLVNHVLENFSIQTGYPPHNSKKVLDDDGFTIIGHELEFAVAGFSKEELDITIDEEYGKHKLVLKGKKANKEKPDIFTHRGIGGRDFSVSYFLPNNLKLKNCVLKDGLLTIVFSVVKSSSHQKVTIE